MRIIRHGCEGHSHTSAVLGQRLHPLPDVAPVREQPDSVCTGSSPSEVPRSLLAPVRPVTVFGMAHNTGHADRALPPQAFLKAAASVAGPDDPIPLPEGIGQVDVEVELAAVVDVPLWQKRPDEIRVLGFTIGLDVTAREAQHRDSLWTEAKSRRGFTPIGPWIETELDHTSAEIELWRNGDCAATGSTTDLARGVPEVISYLSTLVELAPGDVVLTGAPGTFAAVAAGDTVTASITGIGTLTNSVVSAENAVETPVMPGGDRA